MEFFIHLFGSAVLFISGVALNVYFGSAYSKIIKAHSSGHIKRAYVKLYAWCGTLVGIFVVVNSGFNVILFVASPIAIALIFQFYVSIKNMIRAAGEQ